MLLTLDSPTVLRIDNINKIQETELAKQLSYTKKEISLEISKMKKQKYWLTSKWGVEAYHTKMDELKRNLMGTLLFEDQRGYWTYSGLKERLMFLFKGDVTFTSKVTYPDFKLIPWDKKPTKVPRYYQNECHDALVAVPHGHVELATGSGKTQILIQTAKTLGLPTIIMTPSASIGRQIYEECKTLFGKKRVGLFGDGKRELGKHILISIAKSVAMVEDIEELKEFKKYQAIIVDESHTISAELLSKSCLTTLAHCPYRYFFSATQERNDGRDIFLSSIIGVRVYEKSISELQAEGYLAKLSTMMLSVKSNSKYSGDNVILANQHHIYKNENIINFVASTIKVCVESGTPILVLIDELGQEQALRNKLGAGYYGFCEGKSKDNAKVVDQFNDGKILCVVGTKAISVGTDFRANEVTINWTGMRSTTKTKQGVIGRSTRTTATKKEAKLIDFCINNVDTLKRHALARVKLYEEVGAVTWIDL